MPPDSGPITLLRIAIVPDQRHFPRLSTPNHRISTRWIQAKKRGSNRTVADDIRLRELECFVSLYLDEEGAATFPAAAFRTNIETAARKLRQGPQVREGLIVEEVEEFDYDRSLGTSPDELARNVQFTVGVGVDVLGCCVPGPGSMIGRPLSGWMWTPNW